MRFLRQSTASQEILLGPFVAASDGSAQTGLTIANTDIKLLYAGGTSENNKNSGGGTHIAGGRYSAVLDATDTATVGILEVSVNAASGIPWNKSYYVLEEAVYDALFAASAAGYGTAQTGDSFARLGAPAGASVSADIAAIEAQTDDIGAAGAGLTAITALLPAALVGGRIDANVGAVSGDSTAADNLELAFDDTAGAVPWGGIIDQGTAQSATGTTLVLRAAAAFADDEIIGATIVITGGSGGIGQARTITDYVSATDTATVDTWTTTPSGTITYKIFATAPSTGAGGGLDAAGVRAAIGMASANLDTQLSGLDAKLDTIEGQTDDIGAAGAGLTALATAAELAKVPKSDSNVTWNATALASIQSESNDALVAYDPPTRAEATSDKDEILTAVADVPTTAELATALGTADDAVLAAIAALNNLSAAQVNAEVVDALATDTYAEPGQGTPAATAALSAKIGYLYKAWRNRSTQTASEYALYGDDGVTKDQEAACSDDATTFVRGEVATGA